MNTHHIFPGDPIPSYAPGDTLEFHGGKYTGAHVFRTHGTETAPVTITNAPGERVEFTDPTPIPESSAPHSIVLFGKHAVLAENPAGGELRISHPVGAGGIGFAVSADHCHVRNIRVRGAWMNTRARVLGGSISGLVATRIGKDDPLIDPIRGSGYPVYGQNTGAAEFVITDPLFALNYTTGLHLFGGEGAARFITTRRAIIVASACLSSFEAVKPAVVINEENSAATAQCDDILIEDAVLGSPFPYVNGQPYPNPGGFATCPLQLGGPETHVNGRVTLKDVDLIGRPSAAEKFSVRARGVCRIFFRPGTGVENGWVGKANLIPGPSEPFQEFPCVGWPDQLPNLPPQVRAWANPTEPGRWHVSVMAFKNERSVSVQLPGLVRGKSYRAWEAMRETTQEFTAGNSSTVTLDLPDISPAGVQQGRDPHPILFTFLVRRAH